MYEFEFDKNKCPYKNVCSLYNTDSCDSSCIRYMQMHYLTKNALLTDKQIFPNKLVPDPEDIDSFEVLNNIRINIKEFVDKGSNLVICSENNGNGKTQWAIKLLMKYFSVIWYNNNFTTRGMFINVTRLVNSFKDNIGKHSEYLQHIKDNILSADLVIWDDLGVESMTPTEHKYVYGFINDRIDEGKANIVTTNLVGDGLLNIIGSRLYSRLAVGGSVIIFKGKDKRGEIL